MNTKQSVLTLLLAVLIAITDDGAEPIRLRVLTTTWQVDVSLRPLP